MENEQVIAMRLVTGEYVVATHDLQNSKPGHLQLIDPLIYNIIPGSQPKEFGVQFIPLVPLGMPGSSVSLKEDAVMFIMPEVHPEVFKRFQAITSRVVVPSKQVTPAKVHLATR